MFMFKNYQKIKKKNKSKFSNHDISKFILLLGEGIYLYRYTDDWEKFNAISLSKKKIFTVT